MPVPCYARLNIPGVMSRRLSLIKSTETNKIRLLSYLLRRSRAVSNPSSIHPMDLSEIHSKVPCSILSNDASLVPSNAMLSRQIQSENSKYR